MKYLCNKPVRELKGEEFLKLHLAEQDHLLEMKISIDPDQPHDKRWVGTRPLKRCGSCKWVWSSVKRRDWVWRLLSVWVWFSVKRCGSLASGCGLV